MAAKFGKQNHFWNKINWGTILISGLNLPKQGGFFHDPFDRFDSKKDPFHK